MTVNNLILRRSLMNYSPLEYILPTGYTRAEAIVAYGGQWINTGVVMTSEDSMSIDLDLSDLSEPTYLIMGARSSFSSRNITFSKQSSGYGVTCDFNNGDGNTYRYQNDQYPTGRYTLYNSKIRRGIRNLGENSVVCNDSFTCPGPCCIGFWGYGTTTGSSIGVIGKIYGATIDGRFYGIPCIRDIDGEVGMWDMVSQTFFGNSGKGSFSAVFREFPSGYTQLRAVRATGYQWFDLGFKANQNTRIDINIKPTALSATEAQIWIGSYDGITNFYIGPGGSRNWDLYFVPNTNITISYTQQTYELLKTCSVGPTTSASTFYSYPASKSISAYTYATTLDVWMFNRSSVNNQYSNLPAKATFYSCRIFSGSSVIRDLVPAMRDSDDVAGIYDLANNNFYTSMTGTDFVGISL